MIFGAGTLVAIIGGTLWVFSDKQLGFMLLLIGMTVAVLGGAILIVQWGINKSKKRPA